MELSRLNSVGDKYFELAGGTGYYLEKRIG